MGKHQWVELTMTPVDITVVDGQLEVHASDAALEAAKDDKKYGCWFCDQVPLPSNIDAECIMSDD